ncbi:hypothetical protein T265_10839 [Opisthorchis viverrini]|uniref:Uncharacterized protein n=1 Tax=Opisthorchis viverrini TaxID=6198 RepID=A0A074Z582_OPIVI|nr:hypothetical protein T265_10839 [Opisthorchis viverrini]KER20667.1 hypothetical protein T265_10839 [Opisthorchis viverrini]
MKPRAVTSAHIYVEALSTAAAGENQVESVKGDHKQGLAVIMWCKQHMADCCDLKRCECDSPSDWMDQPVR